MPRFSHIWPVRAGHELPAKMSVLRIVADPWGEKKRRKVLAEDAEREEQLRFFFSRPLNVGLWRVILCGLQTRLR